jgi:divalent metal cation (Fe/Co/Zn/Cd) transporter
MSVAARTPEEARAAHAQAGRKIEYVSIAWTTLEAAIGVIAGVLAGSVALIGFGVNSVIEVASSVVLLWRLSGNPDAEEREERAHQLVGVGFLALAAYISYDALHDLISHAAPRVSYFGIAYAAACKLSCLSGLYLTRSLAGGGLIQ